MPDLNYSDSEDIIPNSRRRFTRDPGAPTEPDVLITCGIENLSELIGNHRLQTIFVSHGGGQNASRAIQNSELGATHFVAVSEPARKLFSPAMAEAWYCGVPVVATRVGAVPELERQFGQLVSPVPVHPSPGTLAAAVEAALGPEFRHDVVPRAQALTLR